MIKISIKEDFCDTPGGRFIKDGPHSGEEFFKNILYPSFKKSLETNEKLFIDLDQTYGFGSSFLDQSFGELSRKYDANSILSKIEFKSEDEKGLIDRIKDNIVNPEKYREKN